MLSLNEPGQGCCCASREAPPHDSHEVACSDCGLDPICIELDYTEAGSGVPEGILTRRRKISRGAPLFLQGECFLSLFAVKSGSFKASVKVDGPRDKVVGYYLPGELIGVEAFARSVYPVTVRALEQSSVCELRVERLSEAGRQKERLQQAMIQLLAGEVADSRAAAIELVRQSSDQRVAAFLVGWSRRMRHRHMPWQELLLTLPRSDIASYLGLAGETVSRIFSRFQREGLIRVRGRRVSLRDVDALRAIGDND